MRQSKSLLNWRDNSANFLIASSCALLFLATPVMVWAQSVNSLPSGDLTQPAQPTSDGNGSVLSVPSLSQIVDRFNSNVEVATVRLDGRNLFTVAAPSVDQQGTNSGDRVTSAEERVRKIETILKETVRQANLSSIEVRSELDAQTGLPVIYINQQYLMTVTRLDADIQGLPLQRAVDKITRSIQDALEQAFRERQPKHLMQQGIVTIGIGVLVISMSGLFIWLKMRSRKQQKQIARSLCAAKREQNNAVDQRSDDVSEAQQLQQVKLQKKLSTQKLQTRLYSLAPVVVWIVGSVYVLGLFPQTRELQKTMTATPLKLVAILISIYFLLRLSDAIIDRVSASVFEQKQTLENVSQRLSIRLNTLSQVLKNAFSLLLITAGVLLALTVLGVDLVPVLAGAGIVGLAISFASQSLVKDLINGILILLEDQYAVGDLVKVSHATGLVEHMNLRITQLRDAEGRLITVPNSVIDVVENLSKNWSRVDLTVEIDYRTDPDYALSLLQNMAHQMYEEPMWRDKMLKQPEVLGIDRLDHVGLMIRIWLTTKPLEQFTVAREFRRRLRRLMADENLGIGVPQQLLQAQTASQMTQLIGESTS